MTTSFTRDRGYTRSRRMGRDEEGGEELREMLSDQDASPSEMLAALIQYAPEDRQEELYQALNELASDRRGAHAWAADRLERRRLGRDMRERRARDRRLGRDDPEPFPGRPRPGGGMDPFDDRGYPVENFSRSEADRQIREAGGLDRRRMGSDAMALDGRSPNAVMRYILGG